MRRLDSIIHSMDMNLGKLWETMKDWEAWHVTVHGVTRNRQQLSYWATTSLCKAHHSSAAPFFCLQSFPALGSFPVSQIFASGGQSIGASASVLPMNVQDWFLLGLTGLIPLQSKRLSTVTHSSLLHSRCIPDWATREVIKKYVWKRNC